MAEQDDDFLSRWSRRKGDAKAARLEETAAERSQTGETESKTPDEAEPDEAEIVARLPDIESLHKESDFSAFMKKGVPEALRRRALRKLWTVNPVFSVLDGMNDYDEDFTIAASITEGVKTIYQVGKGMVREDEEETPEDGEPAEAVSAEESGSTEGETPEEGPEQEQEESEAAEADTQDVAEDQDTAAAGPLPNVETGSTGALDPVVPNGGRSPGGSATRRRWGAFRT